MLVETKALVLHSIKYNDSSLIAHCYTKTLGIQSFMLKGILSAKKGKIRKAHFQPMTLLKLQFQHKNKGGLNFIKELRVEQPIKVSILGLIKTPLLSFCQKYCIKVLEKKKLIRSYSNTWKMLCYG